MKPKKDIPIVPLDMRRRPLGGPPGDWHNCNPKPGGPERPFAHYQTNAARRTLIIRGEYQR